MNLIAVVAVAFAVLLSGCDKHPSDASTPSSQQTFDAVQFCDEFASASPELKTLADNAWKCIQSGAFTSALDCLSRLEANPALSDSQRKSVADLTRQVKKQMAANAAGR